MVLYKCYIIIIMYLSSSVLNLFWSMATVA